MRTTMIWVLAVLLVPALVPATSAATGKELRVKDDFMAMLNRSCWGGTGKADGKYVMIWDGCGNAASGDKFGASLRSPSSARLSQVEGYDGARMRATQFCNQGQCGSCTDLVAALTGDPKIVANWGRGRHVIDSPSLARGTIIATFGPDGKFRSTQDHIAVFWGMSNGVVNVIDQNAVLKSDPYGSIGIVGFHSSAHSSDYYVVNV